MSAITGIGDCTTIVLSASTSWSRGTATRTRSAPASATWWIWSIVARRLAVSVFVIVCTATGAPPPTGTPPTMICRAEAICPYYGASPPRRSPGWTDPPRAMTAVAQFVFGYGSLAAGFAGRRARLHGHRRVWGVAMDNRLDIPGYK